MLQLSAVPLHAAASRVPSSLCASHAMACQTELLHGCALPSPANQGSKSPSLNSARHLAPDLSQKRLLRCQASARPRPPSRHHQHHQHHQQHQQHQHASHLCRSLPTDQQPAASSGITKQQRPQQQQLRRQQKRRPAPLCQAVATDSSSSSSIWSQSEDSSELPAGATPEDAVFMRRAVELARTAVGKTSPNPNVGCVIVKDGEVVGEGFHPKAGEPHAEVFALRAAGSKAEGATAYVSLEPCNHFGRTPPCSQALLKAKVKRVVVGTLDPNPLVAGKGVRTLQKGGVEVVVGVEEERCRRVAEGFMFRVVQQRPFSTVRYSMTLDGTVLGDIGGLGLQPGSYYSKLLQEYDAVVVTEAALFSNPSLLSLEDGAQQPLRVVVARALSKLDVTAAVFDTSLAPTLVLTDERGVVGDVEEAARSGGESRESALRRRGVEVLVVGEEVSPAKVLDVLNQRNLCSVLWDCQAPSGSGLESYLGEWAMEDEVVEKVVVAVRPTVGKRKGGSGGFARVSEGLDLERVTTSMCGGDVVIEGYVKKQD